MISSLVAESRFPVGSSARIIAGVLTIARAIATRCCWPPDSCDGRWCARSASPTEDEGRERPFAPGGSGRAVVDHRQLDVLHRGEAGEEVEPLEDEAEPAPAKDRAAVAGKAPHLLPVEAVRPRRRAVQAPEDVHQGRFPRSRGSHHREELPGGDRQVHPLQRLHEHVSQPVRLDEAGDLDRRDAHGYRNPSQAHPRRRGASPAFFPCDSPVTRRSPSFRFPSSSTVNVPLETPVLIGTGTGLPSFPRR